MATIDQFKEQEAVPTPLFVFDCVLSSGAVERWSTHSVTVAGNAYNGRLLQHNLFSLQSASADGLDGPQKIAISLANADSHYSQIERETGFKGAVLTIQFLFYDLIANAPLSEARVVFRGTGNPPDEITEATCRISFTNRLNLQRVLLPEVRIERTCPWLFPADAGQRAEALTGGVRANYSPLRRCGYSADQVGGLGNLSGQAPFTSCDYTRASCIARGMFDSDGVGNLTRSFGGVEFVPSQIQVRSFGEGGSHLTPLIDNLARYNDFVPLVYGTAWYRPPIIFARNDGNLTHLEVLLGMGPIAGVVKVVANGIEIPLGQAGANLSATGWYSLVSSGSRTGAFNLDFVDSTGRPLGDPYGSMAVLRVVLPNSISDGQTLPTVDVLLNGLELERFDQTGSSLGASFTNNSVWVLLDVLRRSGWLTSEIDLASFGVAAAYCEQPITSTDLYGNAVAIPRYSCNLVVSKGRSAAELVTGIRNASLLLLRHLGGLLRLQVENTLAIQQSSLPDGSNSVQTLNGGWPAYEFGDGTSGTTGILRDQKSNPVIRLWSKSGADSPNRLTVEFQDEFNEYQQDSLALVDVDDSVLTASEVTAQFPGLGIPNFDQAARVLRLQLNKTIQGYTFIDFETTVRGIGIRPGDLITVTYLKEGLIRQPFRVIRLAPSKNYLTVQITAQWHDDTWYNQSGTAALGGRRQGSANIALPRPLTGSVIDSSGVDQFGITETVIQGAQGSAVALAVSFVPPATPAVSGSAIPLLSLSPTVSVTGGSLAGGQNFYYALTALDGGGVESGLSFIVLASTTAGSNTNQVTLAGLTFSPGTAGFNVYRGANPSDLLQIAGNVPVAQVFIDQGLSVSLVAPPDGNYDHANFYWRRELQPEVSANIFSSTTIGNTSLGMAVNDFQGSIVRITRGTGSAQERPITANTQTIVTVSAPWTIIPDSSSVFSIADSGWNFAAVANGSPVQIQVPNWGGQTVEISGRSANVLDQESPYALNPLTSWQIGGGGSSVVDRDVPATPIFGLSLAGQGALDLQGIAFTDLTNTKTISSGTLTIYYWDELGSPSGLTLGGTIGATDTSVALDSANPLQANDFVQIEGEVMSVVAVSSNGAQLTVVRGAQNSVRAGHAAGAPVYALKRVITSVPFVPGFFGSPASGSYTHTMYLPDVRVAAAEFYVTNSIGSSAVQRSSYGFTPDLGLRTLSGGQIALQVDGYLAVQTDVTPPFTIESSHAVRDLFATVREAPQGGSIQLQIRQNSTVLCILTIPSGATVSAAAPGFGLAPLSMGNQISLDILSVPTSSNSLPGRDLAVTIRL